MRESPSVKAVAQRQVGRGVLEHVKKTSFLVDDQWNFG